MAAPTHAPPCTAAQRHSLEDLATRRRSMASALVRGAHPQAANDGVLPTDVLREILLRVPAKVLCRLRLVCRSWCSLTSDRRFASAHSARHPLFVGLQKGQRDEENEIHVVDLYSGSIIKRIRGFETFFPHPSMQAGLVCVSTIDTSGRGADTQDLVLNPATGEVSVLPDGIGNRFSQPLVVSTCVIGHVPSTREYKVVRVSNCAVDEIRIKTATEVIALGGGEQRWRTKPSPVDIIVDCRFNQAVVRGVAYFWACKDYEGDDGDSGMVSGLALFDLGTEEWSSTIIPVPLHQVNHIELDSLDGCLVMTYHNDRDCSTDLWFLLKDVDNNKPYWTKRYSMCCAPHWKHYPMYPPRMLTILEDGRIVVWLKWQYVLVVYDPKTQTWENFTTLEYYFAIRMYQGSLLASDIHGWSLAPSSNRQIIDL